MRLAQRIKRSFVSRAERQSSVPPTTAEPLRIGVEGVRPIGRNEPVRPRSASDLDLLDHVPAAVPEAAAVRERRPVSPALAVLLAGHILRDGEVILLILKPSIWFVLFSSLKFAAVMGIVAIASKLWLPEHVAWYYVEAALFVVVGRFMWAILHWMGRLYILTNQRVLRLAGVFTIEVYDCPLRRIGQTRIVRNFREKLFRLGSIEIIPSQEGHGVGVWQTVRKPAQVNAEILDAIRRCRNGSSGGLAA